MVMAAWVRLEMRWRLPLFMNEFQHVLFPVDFSPRCKSTVPYVKEMVRSYKARLTLLHVVEIPLHWYGTMPPVAAGAWDPFEETYRTGQRKLADFTCEYFGDLKLASVETVCDRGDPGYAILAHVEKREADLIMMPTRGQSPFRSFLIGSATARVLHRAECPVWTGAHLENESEAPHERIKNIVCALDLERESVRVIESAVTLARTFSAQVRLVHCVPVPESGPSESFAVTFDRFLADSAGEQLTKIQDQAGTNFEVCLEGGSISKVVRDAAIRYGADIVVIGRGHVQVPFSRLRTNAYAIIRDAPCPVLSV
jgi:nucleotide-binding universal stress UspA family protein